MTQDTILSENIAFSASPFVTIPAQTLQELLETCHSLKDEVEQLKDTIAHLEGEVSTLTSTQEQDTNRLAVDIALDRQRLSKLEQREPQPLQKDRAEILRALIAANGGKMLATEARKTMHLSRPRFSRLLATMKDDIEVKPYHLNKSWQVLALR